eukprot:3896076-Prymnesium_polylepis.1
MLPIISRVCPVVVASRALAIRPGAPRSRAPGDTAPPEDECTGIPVACRRWAAVTLRCVASVRGVASARGPWRAAVGVGVARTARASAGHRVGIGLPGGPELLPC